MIGVLALSALFLTSGAAFGSGDGAASDAPAGVEETPEATTAHPGGGGEGGPSAAALDRIVAGNTRFALDLYRRIKGDGNLFFSPYSVSTALAMTYAGARGETEREMAQVLGFPVAGTSSGTPGEAESAIRGEVAGAFGALQSRFEADADARGYALHVANALWGDRGYPFLESYVGFVGEHFRAPLDLVDFVGDAEGARGKINSWVEDRTQGRIEDLIPPGVLTEATRLVLTNAIYFKGDWAVEFDPERTREGAFRGLSGAATVPMMSRTGDYGYCENDEAQVLEMPYGGGDLSMVALLPRVEGAAGLDALERALTPSNLDAWIGEIREREVVVQIPRFTMTWGSVELRDHLAALGMGRAFSDTAADFSGMSAAGDLFISNVVHKAFVEVNEQGTEAAAATGVVMAKMSIAPPLTFRADRPFVFMIRDRGTGSILFLGRVTDLGE